jgi:CheY-like chemotaxis protein/anti-sigma regulatory factor (Ser/Thr protein kinase)
VSHELRTPLTLSLLPLQQLLARGDLEPWIATRLAVVRDNQLRLLKLINELLDFSRLEAGRGTALYRRFDVGRALRYYLGTLEAAAEERRLRLELRLPEEAVELYVDSEKFEKIVMNLLSNAYKFTPDGGAVIVSVEQANEVVRIAVEDTGVGIPRDELERIFERFSQVDSSARRRYAGTGIGLALVKEFMKLHGGDVTVESELGRGSRFLLHFPRGNAHLDPGCIAADVVAQEAMEVHPEELVAFTRDRVVVVERTAAPGSAGESPVSMPAAGGPRHRVMVVDDLPAMRQMIASFLEPYYDVTVASDGQEALALAQSVVPDLIVSDVMMPQMTGYELCAALRQRPGPLASVPVILVTARAEMTLKLEGLQHGADDYLIKPFNAEELMARIRNLIKVRSQERQLAQTLAELARKEQALREDLEQAYRFQQSMLPQIASSPRRGLHVAALYRPAYIVGGDIFDVCMLGPDRVRVFIADATGHGVQASLRTMVIKSTYDRLKSQCTRPVELLDALNQEILRSGRAEICFSAVCFDLVVREDGGLLRYSSAGHPPIICVAGGSERLLAHRTSILGHSPQIRLAEGETMLEPGARVFGYTDGLCEQQNARGRLFGERRLVRSLADADVSLEETVERAVVTVQQFADKTVLDDDVSLVALEMTRAGTEPAAPVRG